MIRRKKEIKRVFLATLFIITIFISNIQIINNFNILQDKNIDNEYNENLFNQIPKNSNLNLSTPFTGSGVNQDVRIYVNNKSTNLLNNEEYFEIPSITSDDMYLVEGDFNFTFQNNFTTDYVIEDDTALYPENFIYFNYDTAQSGITWNTTHTSLVSGSFNPDLIDNSNSTYMRFNAINGVLNFTISADFTNTLYSIPTKGNVLFNRTKILALISSLIFSLNMDANLTVSIKDYSDSTWKELIYRRPINSGLGIQQLKEHFINENLDFINISTDKCEIRFVFERDDNQQFFGNMYKYSLRSTYAFDIPITNQKYVALEFDLKGELSAVHGFSVWIRTLNIIEAATTQLNITLYRANRTIVRTETNLRTIPLGPDYNEPIDNILVDSYTGDNYTYFEFNIGNTNKLNLSNYFIVIKSNNSQEVYSLVTLPWYDFGDDKTEHQLKSTNNDGVTWTNAQKVITTNVPATPYTSGQLDASLFTLNVTRGYIPSDFIINNNSTLRIQDIPLENLEINSFPYNNRWGLGQWNHNFTTPIDDDPSNNFRVDLTWNKTYIKGFKFNVSYSVNAYWIENASTTYSVTYNTNPEWIFNYTRDDSNPNFIDWDFFEFWFVYYDFLNAQNLTNPNNQEIYYLLSEESPLADNPNRYKLIIPENFGNINGIYSLNLTSYNFLHKMHSYINYNGILWESNGFMYGDNISIAAEIQDHNSKAPTSGDLNAILFYPNGTRYLGAELNSSVGIVDSSALFYDFGNQTILNLTNELKVFGKYQLGFFWFNESAIGCKKLTLYIDSYDVALYNCAYDTNRKTNVLSGLVINRVYHNYTILVASINETTGVSMPNFSPINNTNLDEVYSYNMGGQQLQLLLTSFKQSENILNPNEVVNINVSLQNLHPFIPLNVKVDVKLVSYINEDWIIAQNTSNFDLLYFSGHPDEDNEFSVDLTIPNLDPVTKVWTGVNAPVRLGGAKTIVTVYIDDFIVGEFKSTDYSLLSNETSNNFEGYVLGLKVTEGKKALPLYYDFYRDECIYYPENTTFLVNIIDSNYVSSYEPFTNEFSLKFNSEFTNITINPNTPLEGQIFNISSYLKTEFGVELSGRNVTCQYYENDVWVNISSKITDLNGFTSFRINTRNIDFEGDLLVRLLWEGDSINGVTKEITIDIIQQENNISISMKSNYALVYRNKDASFIITINNIGDSNLRITDISIEIDQGLSYSIVQRNNLLLNLLPSGETTNLIIEVKVKNVNNFNISVSITAQNLITNENVTFSKETSFNTFERPISDYFIEGFMYLMIGIFALTWLVSIIYALKTKKRLETPIEEVKYKPRRGRYVPVAELKKPEPVKKPTPIKKESKEIEEKDKIDLDSLLEERGLSDKEKKPKK
ncbi:MAG: hypothetical protein ACFE9I_13135 [Candidatus Hermodarchaeota archaeon]